MGGIPDEVSEEELREHFCKWGAVVDIYFPGKKGQKRVNYCFVTFDHWRAAHRACNESERNIKGKVSCGNCRIFADGGKLANGPSREWYFGHMQLCCNLELGCLGQWQQCWPVPSLEQHL